MWTITLRFVRVSAEDRYCVKRKEEDYAAQGSPGKRKNAGSVKKYIYLP